MSTLNIYFHGEIRKYLPDTLSYLEFGRYILLINMEPRCLSAVMQQKASIIHTTVQLSPNYTPTTS